MIPISKVGHYAAYICLKAQAEKYPNITLHTAYMPEMFGTHHSKVLEPNLSLRGSKLIIFLRCLFFCGTMILHK